MADTEDNFAIASEFEIKRVEIQKSYPNGQDVARFNIAAVVNEINLFEHIDKPYMTGSVTFSDFDRIVEAAQINGSEKVIIEIAVLNGEQGHSDPLRTVTKTFIISEISRAVKMNDAAQLVDISLIEDIGFLSRLQRISKAYSGSPDEIIASICSEKLNRNVRKLSSGMNTSQPMRVIIPNMTPIDAANWIKDRMSTSNGLPFYLFSTLCDDDLRLVDLESMIQLQPMNGPLTGFPPYTFGQSIDNYKDFTGSKYAIRGYSVGLTDNQLMLSRKGMVGATYNFVNTIKGKNISNKISAQEMFDNLIEGKTSFIGQAAPVYDGRDKIEGKRMHDYDTLEITQIAPTNIYDDGEFHYYEADGIEGHMNKAKQRSFRHFLHKSPIEINVPGYNFVLNGTNVSIGNNILVDIPAAEDVTAKGRDRHPVDKKRSGKYLVYGVRHTFQKNIHSATISCCKLSYSQPEREDY